MKRTTLGARWRCETRDVAVAFGLDDTISVLKATVPGGYGEPDLANLEDGHSGENPAHRRPRSPRRDALHHHNLSHFRRREFGTGSYLLDPRRRRNHL